MPDDTIGTQAEYARHAGISRQAVNKLVAREKIPVREDGKIDFVAADLARENDIERLDDDLDEPDRPSPSSGLTLARTASETYKAKRQQLLYERDLGNLVPVAGVVEATSVCNALIVRIVRRLSNRAEELASAAQKGGAQNVRGVLRGIERDMLRQFAEAFEKLATNAASGAPAPEPEDEEQQ